MFHHETMLKNDRRTEGLKFRTQHVPKNLQPNARHAASRRVDHRAVMSKVDLKFDAGKLHFKLLGQMEFFKP